MSLALYRNRREPSDVAVHDDLKNRVARADSAIIQSQRECRLAFVTFDSTIRILCAVVC
jgi:hypothetical protein